MTPGGVLKVHWVAAHSSTPAFCGQLPDGVRGRRSSLRDNPSEGTSPTRRAAEEESAGPKGTGMLVGRRPKFCTASRDGLPDSRRHVRELHLRGRVFRESSVPGNAQVCGSGKATAIWSFRHCKPAACIPVLNGANMRLSLVWQGDLPNDLVI